MNGKDTPKALDGDATALVSAVLHLLGVEPTDGDDDQRLLKKLVLEALTINYLAGARSALAWRVRHIDLSTCMSGHERVAVAGDAIRESMEKAIELPDKTLVAKMDHPGNGEIIQ